MRFGIFRFQDSPVVEQTAWILLHVALVAALFGIAPRLSCLLSALLLYHFAPFEGLLPGFVDLAGLTGLTLPMLGLLILAFAEIPHRSAPWSPEYRWPLVLLQLILAFHYVNAGLGKMHWAGFAWYTSENVRILAGVFWGFNKPSLALMVLDRPWIAGAIGVCTFLLEFLFPLAIISRRARWVILPAAAVAVVLRIHVFGFFTLSFPLLLLFLNWDYIDSWLRKRAGEQETPVEVELNLLAAQRQLSPSERARAESIVRGSVDWRRTVEYAQLHGTTQLLNEMLEKLGHRLVGEFATVLGSLVQRNSARSLVQYRETRRIVTAFAAAGIRTAAYKGPALSVALYGRANARISGDIDILIEARDFRAASTLLSDHGYKRGGYEVSDEVYLARWKDATFSNDRIHCSVELQWRAFAKNSSCGFQSETSQLKTSALPSDPSMITVDDVDLFLLLAHHGLTHRWESLKWLADIDAFCQRADVAWLEIAKKARETGSWNIVLLAIHVSAELLHTPVPEPFRSVPPRVARIASRLSTGIRQETELSDLDGFLLQFAVRERWRDRVRFLRFVCTPKPRDIAEGKFLGMPRFLQPLLRPLRLVVESHSGHKRAVTDVQKVIEWQG